MSSLSVLREATVDPVVTADLAATATVDPVMTADRAVTATVDPAMTADPAVKINELRRRIYGVRPSRINRDGLTCFWRGPLFLMGMRLKRKNPHGR